MLTPGSLHLWQEFKKVVTEGFAGIHADMDKLRHEFKEEIDGVKSTIKHVEKSLTSTQDDVESLKETVKKVSDANTNSMKALNDRILKLEKKLKLETERNTQLEQYTRRENLRFTNIKETEGEDCKALICDILQKDMKLDASSIKFHAVHRVGKKCRKEQGRS